jgi:hypothetical protein
MSTNYEVPQEFNVKLKILLSSKVTNRERKSYNLAVTWSIKNMFQTKKKLKQYKRIISIFIRN